MILLIITITPLINECYRIKVNTIPYNVSYNPNYQILHVIKYM